MLFLMKLAYINLLKVKKILSIGNMIEKYREAQVILVAPVFKSLEGRLASAGVVSGEELQIAIFLSNMRKEVLEISVGEISKIVYDELSNLFTVVCTEGQMRWIMQAHSRLVLGKRAAYGSTEALTYCLELKDCMMLEDFFKQKVEMSRQFRDNEVFKARSLASEKELLSLLDLASLGLAN